MLTQGHVDELGLVIIESCVEFSPKCHFFHDLTDFPFLHLFGLRVVGAVSGSLFFCLIIAVFLFLLF